jgi:hypothetical protein
MTNEQQQSPIFCLDKLKKLLYNTIWGIKQLQTLAVGLLGYTPKCPAEGRPSLLAEYSTKEISMSPTLSVTKVIGSAPGLRENLLHNLFHEKEVTT